MNVSKHKCVDVTFMSLWIRRQSEWRQSVYLKWRNKQIPQHVWFLCLCTLECVASALIIVSIWGQWRAKYCDHMLKMQEIEMSYWDWTSWFSPRLLWTTKILFFPCHSVPVTWNGKNKLNVTYNSVFFSLQFIINSLRHSKVNKTVVNYRRHILGLDSVLWSAVCFPYDVLDQSARLCVLCVHWLILN